MRSIGRNSSQSAVGRVNNSRVSGRDHQFISTSVLACIIRRDADRASDNSIALDCNRHALPDMKQATFRIDIIVWEGAVEGHVE